VTPRVRIRQSDIRQNTPNTPSRDAGEELSSRGRYFEADCTATDVVGDFVRVTGAPVNAFYQVGNVDITIPAHMPVAGIITEKSTLTRCFVVRFGIVDVGLFPSPPVLVPGQKYWVGFDGRLTPSMPVPVSGISIVQLIGHALSQNELLLLEGSTPFKLKR